MVDFKMHIKKKGLILHFLGKKKKKNKLHCRKILHMFATILYINHQVGEFTLHSDPISSFT